MKFLVSIALICFYSFQANSQYLISNGGTHTVCSGTFYDSGVTVSPSDSNCLTIKFESDGIFTSSGWEANIYCSTCPTCSDGIQNGSETGIDCGGSCTGCTGATCATARVITSLPFNTDNLTTQYFGNNYTDDDACNSPYMNGEDYVFEYTPSTDTCINIQLSNTDQYIGLFLFDGCPDNSTTNCVQSAGNNAGNPSITENHLLADSTYYIVVSKSSGFTPFDISIEALPCPTCYDGIQNAMETGIDCGGSCPACPGATCATANVITTLPFNATNLTTQDAGNDYSSEDACYSFHINGNDYVFEYTPTSDTCINIVISNFNQDAAWFLMDGCPDDSTTSCLLRSDLPHLEAHLIEGVTYYIVVSNYPGQSNSNMYTNFDISIEALACPTCSDGIKNGNEVSIDCGGGTCPICPGRTCASANIITSVPYIETGFSTHWSVNDYSLPGNSSGEEYVFEYTPAMDTCITIGLTDASGNSGNYLYLFEGCPDDTASSLITMVIGGNPTSPIVLIEGGITYYIIVSTTNTYIDNIYKVFGLSVIYETCLTCNDGILNGDETGVDCGGVLCEPCIYSVQDCLGAIEICKVTYAEDSAYYGEGLNPNEINSANGGCLNSGEKNDVWYIFTAQRTGQLCFSITPNVLTDDYDWAIYNITNATCADIYNDETLEVSCNYSGSAGVTGPNGDGNINDEPCLTVNQGETFVINVSQFSTSINGYTIDFNTPELLYFQGFSEVIPASDGLSLNLYLSEPSFCENIVGSENCFSLIDSIGDTSSIAITQAFGDNCQSGGNIDSVFTLTLSEPLTPYTNYTLVYNCLDTANSDSCHISNTAPIYSQSGFYFEPEANIGLKENNIENLFFTPNPTSSLVEIKGLYKESNYKILDLQGRILLEGKTQNEIMLDLPNGVYVIHLERHRPKKLIVKN